MITIDPIRLLLHGFWSSFGVPAYNNTLVAGIDLASPPPMPYITYNVVRPPVFGTAIMGVNVYDRSTSFVLIDSIKKRISDAIPEATGVTLDADVGSIRLFRGSPFIQELAEGDDVTIRRAYVNIELRNLSIWS